jgi:hypothetical protein
MKASESPFPCRWVSFDLENVGLGKLRGRSGTYAKYDFFALPPLPFELNGDWNWLRRSQPVERNITEDRGYLPEGIPPLLDRLKSALVALPAATAAAGLQLPDSFVRFFSDGALAERIRSNTDSFVDVSPGLAQAPTGDGHFVRFLSDSQGCLFWFLYLAPNGDHAVLSSKDFYGSAEEEDEYYGGDEDDMERRKPDSVSFAAESFEEFMCRFWLENEIWHAGAEGREMTAEGKRYIKAYLNGAKK